MTSAYRSCILKINLLLAGLLLAAGPGQAQRVGLVLSGGGAKGLAHIGVLKQLEQNHIPFTPDALVAHLLRQLETANLSPENLRLFLRKNAAALFPRLSAP